MMPMKFGFLSITMTLLVVTSSNAETVYVTDQLKAGLHEEKTLDSPIIKLVPTATRLEVIKREENLSFVRDPKGVTGWMDNSFLENTVPADGQIKTIQANNANLTKQLATANQQIKRLQARTTSKNANAYNELEQKHATLQQQYNSERLQTGELKMQLSELRKRIGMNNDNASLYEQIEQLQQDNKSLEIQLAAALDGDPEQAVIRATDSSDNNFMTGWRGYLVLTAIAILLGFCLGIYLMDYFNRRRHGGFRI